MHSQFGQSNTTSLPMLWLPVNLSWLVVLAQLNMFANWGSSTEVRMARKACCTGLYYIDAMSTPKLHDLCCCLFFLQGTIGSKLQLCGRNPAISFVSTTLTSYRMISGSIEPNQQALYRIMKICTQLTWLTWPTTSTPTDPTNIFPPVQWRCWSCAHLYVPAPRAWTKSWKLRSRLGKHGGPPAMTWGEATKMFNESVQGFKTADVEIIRLTARFMMDISLFLDGCVVTNV